MSARIKRAPSWRPRAHVKHPKFKKGLGFRVDQMAAQRVARHLIEASADSIRTVMDRELVRIMEEAYDDWPRRTGHSAEQLSLTWRRSADKLFATLNNKADYARFIRRGETARELIAKPAEKAEPEIAKEVGKVVEVRAKRGGRR